MRARQSDRPVGTHQGSYSVVDTDVKSALITGNGPKYGTEAGIFIPFRFLLLKSVKLEIVEDIDRGG